MERDVVLPPDLTVMEAIIMNGNMHTGKGTDALSDIRALKAFFLLLPPQCDIDVVEYILDIMYKKM